jgi:hypothetical protein
MAALMPNSSLKRHADDRDGDTDAFDAAGISADGVDRYLRHGAAGLISPLAIETRGFPG